MTQFDTNQLVLELQHSDTISQQGNNGNKISRKQLIIMENCCI